MALPVGTRRAAGRPPIFFAHRQPCKYRVSCYPEVSFSHGGMPNGVDDCMLDMMVMGILGGLAALVAFEIYQEVRGSSRQLEDRYHE
jgi:hypothetical protein